MTFIIDAHEDLAYNALSYQRDYTCSAEEIRLSEKGTKIPSVTGEALIGWPDYQVGQVALVFGTLFILPSRYKEEEWASVPAYDNEQQAHRLYREQVDYYSHLCDLHPEKFRLVHTLADLKEILKHWQRSPACFPDKTHPTGVVILMESAEGLQSPQEIEEWWQAGVRIVGPVWGGTRYCGGTREPGGFTREGFELLDIMAGLGITLDVSHMNERSILQALDYYEGNVCASHANVRALLKEDPHERHLSDSAIRRLIEREGVIGVIPFNKFLKSDWKPGDDPKSVTLDTLASHIDYICQLAGDARHVGIGTDFDGGFGYPAVPAEINTIADMQKLDSILHNRGYKALDVDAILEGNWRRFLEKSLPV